MPSADRNLDAIFRSEQPDKAQIRVLAEQLAEAIEHVHSKGLIHGDVKLQNVVRFGEGLHLIDLDAAAEIDSFADAKNESYAGANFLVRCASSRNDRQADC
jgi:serine/threonine protein kinase